MFVRFWLKAPLGVAALGLYLEATAQTAHAVSSAGAILWAVAALGGLFAASYLWHRWWAAAAGAAAANAFVLWAVAPAHPSFFLTVLFAALIGWWANLKPGWPLKPWHAFLGIGILVMVSLSLSALLGMRMVPVNTHTVLALAVLYLATPPWEWTIILIILAQNSHLGTFVRENYRLSRRTFQHALMGILTGVAVIAVTALIVAVESHGLKMHVRPNNPFVYAPGLSRQRAAAAALVGVGVVILAPLAEEALFRGILFGTLSRRWGFWWGSLASAAIFGLAHLDLSLLIPLALAGFIFNLLYHRTHSMIPSTVAHATLNAVSVLSALGVAGLWHL